MCYGFTFGGVVINGEFGDQHVECMAHGAHKDISYGASVWIQDNLPTIKKAYMKMHELRIGNIIIPVSEVIDEIDNLTFEAPDTCDQATHNARVNFFKWWAVESIRDFGDDAKLYVS